MSLQDLNFHHLKLISTYAARYAIRGGTGLVFVILALSCGLLMAHFILSPVEQVKEKNRAEGLEMKDEDIVKNLIDIARPVVVWVIGGASSKDASEEGMPDTKDENGTSATEWASYLLDEKPALLSAVLLLMLFASPFLVALGAFNQFSGDVQTKGLRYQLLRTERTNIFFGRFLGTALYTVLVMALLISIIVLYLGLKINIYGWGALIVWSLRGLLALGIVCLPYVALCSWMSSMIDSPFGSLTINTLIVGAVPLFAFLGKNTWEPVAYVNYALPWGVQNYLLHPSTGSFLGAIAACCGYTLVFLFLGHRYFVKRDL